MNKEKIRTYDELNMDEREVLDSFRRIKLLWDQTRFRLYKYKIEDLLTDYEQMIQLRQGIQAKYYEIINELNEVDLIEGELDSHKWVMHREQENLVWAAEMQLLDGIKMVQVTLWDGNNQPLANKTVSIRAYDSVWRGVTDENGDAFVRVGIGFGTHDATVSFDGDDQYNSSTRAGYIRVIKQTPSVMVRCADTMFKANDDNKIVKVHLRDRYDKALPEGSKIVIKLNGKTYVGTTDINGVAHIKININTVGTFTAQAMYGGNTAYNPVTRDVKIRIV